MPASDYSELAVPQLERLKRIKSRTSLAHALGYDLSNLTSILYGIPKGERYTKFTIPKKGGGERGISAPNAKLKEVQRRLARLLYLCIEDLEEIQPSRRKVSHGFHKSRGILSNAAAHRNRRYVLNLDLKDFFGSINFGRVRGFFQSDSSFLLPPIVAETIAHIACHEGSLPQGSPCSPVVSNLIGHILDVRMLNLAKRSKIRYTRYADDISFSTNAKKFPPCIAVRDTVSLNVWSLSEELLTQIGRAGFETNPSKTRMQIRGSRQQTTGLIVNDIVNVRREYYCVTRAMCHRLFTTGSYISPDQPKATTELSILEGRLSFVHQVKLFNGSIGSDADKTKDANQSSFEVQYANFLFYKYFIAPTVPVIFTEGPSDQIYLKTAIMRRAEHFVRLVDPDAMTLRVRLLQLKDQFRGLLQLTAGTMGIGDLIRRYPDIMMCFKNVAPMAPIILLVDNDEAAKKTVFGAATAFEIKTGAADSKISIGSDDRIHFMGHNLYLVKIPHGGSKSEKVIEDLLPPDWLNVPLDGKKFDPKKKHGDHSSLGKVAFAQGVIQANASKIDFSGFDALFELFTAVIDDYEARTSVKTP